MEVGIREARNSLSKLLEAVRGGEEVFLTNRGDRVAQLVPVKTKGVSLRGYGFLKGKINFYPGWDSPEEDKRIEKMFEDLSG